MLTQNVRLSRFFATERTAHLALFTARTGTATTFRTTGVLGATKRSHASVFVV